MRLNDDSPSSGLLLYRPPDNLFDLLIVIIRVVVKQ
jgi:hypothetical protein